MNRRLLAAAGAGALVFTVFGWFWGAILPFAEASEERLPNESTFKVLIEAGQVEDGVYRLPALPDPEDFAGDEAGLREQQRRVQSQRESGTVMRASISRQGEGTLGLRLFRRLVCAFLAALVAAWMILHAAERRLSDRALVVVMMALFSALDRLGTDALDLGFGWFRLITLTLESTIGWGLAAWAMAALAPPRRAS